MALLAIAFRMAYPELAGAWKSDEYSHGALIPPIAALLAWHILAREKPAPQPSSLGPIAIAAAGCLLLIGTMSAFPTIAQYGIILALAGLGLTFLGKTATRLLIPAFVYLVFAVPLPHLTYATLSENLQLLSSTIGVWLLDACGVPVYQEGNIIDLGTMKLQVAEACSGLRYLFPLMSFGYLVAYLLQDRWWKRIVVFLSSIPIAILTNSVRIALIGLTVNVWGPAMAGGLIHDIEGWVIFLACITFLSAEVWLLIGPDGHFRFEYLGPAHGRLINGNLPLAPQGIAALVVLALLAGVFGSGVIDRREDRIVAHPAFAQFPLALELWQGRQRSLEPDVLAGLQLSDYFMADYQHGDGAPVNFYMAYYNSQRIGSATHSPANCIPGGGWQIASSRIVTVPGVMPLRVSRLIIRKGDVAQLVYYWFDERGRDLTETTTAKWYTMIDAIGMHRSDGALIRLVTPIDATEEEADKRLTDFLVLALPQINHFVPGANP